MVGRSRLVSKIVWIGTCGAEYAPLPDGGYQLWLIGGCLPQQDHAALRDLGFKGIFPTGSKLDAIVDYIRNNVNDSARTA